MSKMLKSSGAMGAATLLSRVLGMVREIVYARFMGTGWVADAFIFAFMVPNLFRRLLGEGALTAAFVPLFKEKEIKEGQREMWRAANAVLSGLVIAASVVVGLAMLGLSWYLAVGAPSEANRLTFELMRFMFPYMLLVCVTALFMGMLNSRGHFFIPAMGATMLNVVMIAFTLWVAPRMAGELPTQVFGLAIGVLVAGLAQMLFQWPTLHQEGFRPRWVNPLGNETVRLVVQRMIPGTLGVAAFQVNVFLTQGIAKLHGEGILSSFNYGVRLMELPQGLFGITLATFLLPTLSQLVAEKKLPEFRATLREGVGNLIFVNGLAAVLLGVLAEPIVRLLFEGGEFTALSTLSAAAAVLGLAPGLIAFSLVNILARAFYATGDTRTPMRISIVCLLLNIALAYALIIPGPRSRPGQLRDRHAERRPAGLRVAQKSGPARLGRTPWTVRRHRGRAARLRSDRLVAGQLVDDAVRSRQQMALPRRSLRAGDGGGDRLFHVGLVAQDSRRARSSAFV
jgi:putative peptidoglycan lipid II flippase